MAKSTMETKYGRGMDTTGKCFKPSHRVTYRIIYKEQLATMEHIIGLNSGKRSIRAMDWIGR